MNGRQLIRQIALGRVVLGVSMAVGPAFPVLFGHSAREPTARFAARLAGVRDVALGVATLWAMEQGDAALERAVLLAAAVDASDMMSALAGRGMGVFGRWSSVMAAGGTAVAGGWAARELRAGKE